MPFSDATTVSEMLTNFNGPSYHGVLHKASPEATPFKTLILGAQGGIGQGAVQVGSMTDPHREFEWQFYDLRTPSASRQRPDGFKPSSVENRKRTPVNNLIQTHTEPYEVAFERMSQTEQFDGINAGQGPNPVQDELGWQGQQMLKQINLDQELSLLYSTYHKPADNTQPARTRGINQAIATNRVAADGAPLSWDLLVEATKAAVDVAGAEIGEGIVAMCNSDQLAQISKEFFDKGLQPRDREVYGVGVTTVKTPFGNVNLLFNRHVKQGQVIGVNPTHLRTWHRFVPPHDDIPGGITFTYRMARAGNATERSIYSSIGLEYGMEKAHFSIDGLKVSDASAS